QCLKALEFPYHRTGSLRGSADQGSLGSRVRGDSVVKSPFTLVVSGMAGLLQEERESAMPLTRKREGGVSAERAMIDVDAGQRHACMSRTGDHGRYLVLREPLLKREMRPRKDPAAGGVRVDQPAKRSSRARPVVLPSGHDLQRHARFMQQ